MEGKLIAFQKNELHLEIEERTYPLGVRALQFCKPPEKSENKFQRLTILGKTYILTCSTSMLGVPSETSVWFTNYDWLFGRAKVALKYDISQLDLCSSRKVLSNQIISAYSSGGGL